jgi:hypothetical protein
MTFSGYRRGGPSFSFQSMAKNSARLLFHVLPAAVRAVDFRTVVLSGLRKRTSAEERETGGDRFLRLLLLQSNSYFGSQGLPFNGSPLLSRLPEIEIPVTAITGGSAEGHSSAISRRTTIQK